LAHTSVDNSVESDKDSSGMSIQLIVTKAIVYLVKAITTLASRVCVMIARSVKHLVA